MVSGIGRIVCDRLEAGSNPGGACSGKLPLLETLLAENGTPLGRPEGHRSVLTACRAGGLGFHTVRHRGTRGNPVGPLGLAPFAALRLVLELLISEEELFTGRPDELRAAIHTPQGLVLELHRSPPRELVDPIPRSVLRFPPELLAVSLPCEGLLGPTLVTRLEIERVLLDVLDDVFLLDLALETPKRALDRLACQNLDFSHACQHPLAGLVAPCERLVKVANMLGYHRQARILGATRPRVNEIVGVRCTLCPTGRCSANYCSFRRLPASP